MNVNEYKLCEFCTISPTIMKYLAWRYSVASGCFAREKKLGSSSMSLSPRISVICISLFNKQVLIFSLRHCRLLSTTSSAFRRIELMTCWLSRFSSLVFKINKAIKFVISSTRLPASRPSSESLLSELPLTIYSSGSRASSGSGSLLSAGFFFASSLRMCVLYEANLRKDRPQSLHVIEKFGSWLWINFMCRNSLLKEWPRNSLQNVQGNIVRTCPSTNSFYFSRDCDHKEREESDVTHHVDFPTNGWPRK